MRRETIQAALLADSERHHTDAPEKKRPTIRSQKQQVIEARIHDMRLGGAPDPFPMAATRKLRDIIAELAPDASFEIIKAVAIRNHTTDEQLVESFRWVARQLEYMGLSGRSRYLWRVIGRIAPEPAEPVESPDYLRIATDVWIRACVHCVPPPEVPPPPAAHVAALGVPWPPDHDLWANPCPHCSLAPRPAQS